MVTLTNIQGWTEISRDITRQTAALDTVTSVWVGPTSQLLSFLPAKGSPHGAFPLMQLWQVSVKDEASGTLSEVTMSYKGRLSTNGVSKFVSENIVDEQWSEKEFSYQSQNIYNDSITNTAFQGWGSTVGGNQTWQFYVVYTDSYAVRYITNNVKIRYCANFDPAGIGQYSGLGLGKCAIESQWVSITSRSVASYEAYSLIPTVPAVTIAKQLVGLTVRQFNNWYECEEIYEQRWVTV